MPRLCSCKPAFSAWWWAWERYEPGDVSNETKVARAYQLITSEQAISHPVNLAVLICECLFYHSAINHNVLFILEINYVSGQWDTSVPLTVSGDDLIAVTISHPVNCLNFWVFKYIATKHNAFQYTNELGWCIFGAGEVIMF